MANWRCVKNCGACCHLDPTDRPELDSYLSPEELEQYLSMVGEGGWCIYYHRLKRECTIYDRRPRFCRVQLEIFEQMYEIEASEFNDFAIECCHDQIAGVYGYKSPEMQSYRQQVR